VRDTGHGLPRAADPDLKSEKNTVLAIELSGIDVRAVPR
jgi:hypothetical protein